MQRPRDQFLSRSAFSLNQDGPVGWSGPLDEPEHLVNCGRSTDHFPLRFVALQQQLQLLVLFAELAPLRQAGLGALSQFQAQPLGIFRTGGEPGELFRPPPLPPGQVTMGGLGLFGGGQTRGQQTRQQLQMGGLGSFVSPEVQQRGQEFLANLGPIPAGTPTTRGARPRPPVGLRPRIPV